MRTTLALAALFAAASFGCREKLAATTSDTPAAPPVPSSSVAASSHASALPTPAPSGSTRVVASFDKKEKTFFYANVTDVGPTARLWLTEKATNCDNDPTGDFGKGLTPGEGATITVPLRCPPGKNGCAAPVDYHDLLAPKDPQVQGSASLVPPHQWQPTIHVEPFELKVGGKVAGKIIDVDEKLKSGTFSAHGVFEATICSVGNKVLDDYAKTPLSGECEGTKFTPKTALAIMTKRKGDGTPLIEQVYFFDAAGTCGDLAKLQRGSYLRAYWLAITATTAPKDQLPGEASFRNATSQIESQLRGSWLRVDSIDVKPGGSMNGAFVVSGEMPRGSFNGLFEAKICDSLE